MKCTTTIVMMVATCLAVLATERPNIILVMADDWGAGSAGCYGAPEELIRTPAIDRLAGSGAIFTDASTPSSVCSPTRYGLLTGRYPWRSRMKRGVVGVQDPLLLDPDRPTIASWLKTLGYQTAAIGKWHLGYGAKKKKSAEEWTKPDGLKPGPLELGFDYHFGVPQNHGDATGIYVENHGVWGLESDKVFPFSKNFYGGQWYGFDAPQRVDERVMVDLTDRAVEWVKQQSGEKPFFLYLAPVAVHHPITPSPKMRGESGCGPYGDFIQDLDWSIERLQQVVSAKNGSRETLFILTSDNGGDLPNGETRPETTARRLGLKSNGDLRGDKHSIYQGGVRVPLIASWPERFPGGTTHDGMVNLVDLFATLGELLDSDWLSAKKDASDSHSFASALLNPEESRDRQEAMVTTDADGNYAIRRGEWKLVEGRRESGDKDRALYHLGEDPSESKNVLAQNKEVAKELKKELDQIRRARP